MKTLVLNLKPTILKSILFTVTWCLITTLALGQSVFKNEPYFMMTPDVLFKLAIHKDSLTITQCSYDFVPLDIKYQYKVRESIKKDSFLVLYVETIKHLSNSRNDSNKFQILTIRFSESNKKLNFTNEINFFPSISSCKSQDLTNLHSKFSFTYYNEELINKFNNYRNPLTLDLKQIGILTKTIQLEALANKEAVANTNIGDVYGTVITREIINRSMVQLKINPLFRSEQLDRLFIEQR